MPKLPPSAFRRSVPWLALAIVGGCKPTASKDAPAPSATSAPTKPSSPPGALPSDPYSFNCADGGVALGLGYGGSYSQSIAWESPSPGTAYTSTAPVLCSRSGAVDACIADEKRRQDGGALGTVDLVVVSSGGNVTVEGETARPVLAQCVGAALRGTQLGADGRLRYRYVVDAPGGRLGVDRQPRGPKITDSVTGSGALPMVMIRRGVRMNFGRLRACYVAALKTNPTLRGTATISMVVDGMTISRPKWESGTLPDETMRTCIIDAYAKGMFPPSDGPTNVVATFTFEPPD